MAQQGEINVRGFRDSFFSQFQRLGAEVSGSHKFDGCGLNTLHKFAYQLSAPLLHSLALPVSPPLLPQKRQTGKGPITYFTGSLSFFPPQFSCGCLLCPLLLGLLLPRLPLIKQKTVSWAQLCRDKRKSCAGRKLGDSLPPDPRPLVTSLPPWHLCPGQARPRRELANSARLQTTSLGAAVAPWASALVLLTIRSPLAR